MLKLVLDNPVIISFLCSKNDFYLNLALEIPVDFVISLDLDLLDLEKINGVVIARPIEFLEICKTQT